MRSRTFFVTFITLFSIGFSASAQVDPSSALLLNSSGDTTVRESGIGSGRYTVRPKSDPKKETGRSVRSETAPEPVVVHPAPTATPAPTPVPQMTPAPVQPGPQTKPAQTKPQAPAQQVSPAQAAAQVPQANPQINPPSAQAAQIPPTLEARPGRLMLMELSFAPGYLYNSSESNYSFRNYNTAAPTIAADARVWISPSVAVQTGYLGTLSASVSDSTNGSRSVAAAQQWFNFGVRSRSFIGVSRLAPSLSASFDYYEYEFRAPSDAQMRAKLKSTGVRIAVDAELPVTPYRSWTLGFSLVPKLQHKEGATAVNFQSGGNVDANQVGLSVGSNIRFDAKSSMFIKLSHMVEKDLFTGPASMSDPVTGQTPTGVSVTNSFTLIQLGYTWGN